MGYHLKSFTELVADGAWADVGMYIGAGTWSAAWSRRYSASNAVVHRPLALPSTGYLIP